MNPVKDFLEATTQLMAMQKNPHRIGRYGSLTDFILKNGRDFTLKPLPQTVRRGRMKECFKNAAERVLFGSHTEPLFYCEGYATGVIPVHHAWLCNARGEAFECTWRKEHTPQFYFGVPFQKEFLRSRILETESYHSLIDDWENRWPLLSLPAEQWLETDFR